jgi:Delta3-Delta2-enoyl-CoA isomerase
LNAFGDRLGDEVVMALRELNEHPDTIFTVLTGVGRFFSSGADVRGKWGFIMTSTVFAAL